MPLSTDLAVRTATAATSPAPSPPARSTHPTRPEDLTPGTRYLRCPLAKSMHSVPSPAKGVVCVCSCCRERRSTDRPDQFPAKLLDGLRDPPEASKAPGGTPETRTESLDNRRGPGL